MMFSVYYDNRYSVVSLEADETIGEPMDAETPAVDEDATVAALPHNAAGILPPIQALGEGLVADYLGDPTTGLPTQVGLGNVRPYSPRLRLDYVAPPTVRSEERRVGNGGSA